MVTADIDAGGGAACAGVEDGTARHVVKAP
jgi:hypothetical protein